MKKRIAAAIVAIVLLVSLMPLAAQAANVGFRPGGDWKHDNLSGVTARGSIMASYSDGVTETTYVRVALEGESFIWGRLRISLHTNTPGAIIYPTQYSHEVTPLEDVSAASFIFVVQRAVSAAPVNDLIVDLLAEKNDFEPEDPDDPYPGFYIMPTDVNLSGVLGIPFRSRLRAEWPDYQYGVYTIVDGDLPYGLTLDASGLIHGIPAEPGTFFIFIGPPGAGYDEPEFSIRITIRDDLGEGLFYTSQGLNIVEPIGMMQGFYFVFDPGYGGEDGDPPPPMAPPPRPQWVKNNYDDEDFVIGGGVGSGNLLEVYFNRDRLVYGRDYTARDGSVKITIQSQTFRSRGDGDHTVSAVFEVGDIPLVAAQSFNVSNTKQERTPEPTTEPTTAPTTQPSTQSPQQQTSGQPQEGVFSDVNAVDWFFESVSWAIAKGVMLGVGNGAFAPLTKTTDAMVVTVLARIAGVDLAQYEDADSEDGASSEWYSAPAAWAKSIGLLGDKDFNSDQPVSRGEFALIAVRLLDYLGADYDLPETQTEFADAQDMTPEEFEAFQILYSLGIFKGTGQGKMDPQDAITRAQLAALLQRIYDVFDDSGDSG